MMPEEEHVIVLQNQLLFAYKKFLQEPSCPEYFSLQTGPQIYLLLLFQDILHLGSLKPVHLPSIAK